jgi:hypothetical protein
MTKKTTMFKPSHLHQILLIIYGVLRHDRTEIEDSFILFLLPLTEVLRRKVREFMRYIQAP